MFLCQKRQGGAVNALLTEILCVFAADVNPRDESGDVVDAPVCEGVRVGGARRRPRGSSAGRQTGQRPGAGRCGSRFRGDAAQPSPPRRLHGGLAGEQTLAQALAVSGGAFGRRRRHGSGGQVERRRGLRGRRSLRGALEVRLQLGGAVGVGRANHTQQRLRRTHVDHGREHAQQVSSGRLLNVLLAAHGRRRGSHAVLEGRRRRQRRHQAHERCRAGLEGREPRVQVAVAAGAGPTEVVVGVGVVVLGREAPHEVRVVPGHHLLHVLEVRARSPVAGASAAPRGRPRVRGRRRRAAGGRTVVVCGGGGGGAGAQALRLHGRTSAARRGGRRRRGVVGGGQVATIHG